MKSARIHGLVKDILIREGKKKNKKKAPEQ